MHELIAAGIGALILLLILWRRAASSSFGAAHGDSKYLLKGDAAAQANYDKSHKNFVKMTSAELLELSWKFLYEITEKVMGKFSEPDRQEVHRLGALLYSVGMRYQHVVDFQLLTKPSKVLAAQQNKEQSESVNSKQR